MLETLPREAKYYERLPDQQVTCTLCPHNCRIHNGGRGVCGVRVNVDGTLRSIVYNKIVSRGVEPIEKKPLFHFMPGTTAYSIATVGCCLRCAYCQNWEISQWPKMNLSAKLEPSDHPEHETLCPQVQSVAHQVPGEQISPQEIVDSALACGASTIAYTYTEPTVFYELCLDTSKIAHEAGLRNIFVTSGYINPEPLNEIAPWLDGVNVDLKFFRDESYRRISRVRLEPVLNAIRQYHQLGIWLEVTTLIVPGINDSDEELSDIAQFIVSINPAIPWHISQFYPAYKMTDIPHTPLATLQRARQIGLAAGLRYVYEGNVPGHGAEATYCPNCEAMLIDRYGFSLQFNRIIDGRCPECGAKIDGVMMDGAPQIKSHVPPP